ncbi:MAG: hypothetical protein ABUL65_00095, partial [Opitutus sp.]
MYNVILVNLAPDARSFAAMSHLERHDVGTEDLVGLLRNFCEVDPVENTTADAEIRVLARRESYLLRTEQKKLILYDTRRRDIPAQILTVEEAMAELDGTASAQRIQAILEKRAEVAPAAGNEVLLERAPPAAPSMPRMIALAAVAVGLLAAIIFLAAPFGHNNRPAGFVLADKAERAGLEARLIGVYMTGSEPGQHGIVVTGPRELKLFEMGTVEAPRVVYANY